MLPNCGLLQFITKNKQPITKITSSALYSKAEHMYAAYTQMDIKTHRRIKWWKACWWMEGEEHLQRETYEIYENVWIGIDTTINAVCCKSVWWQNIEKCRLKFILVDGSLLTPCSRVLEKLTGSQLVRKSPTFYGIRNFITAFTSARPLFLSWAVNGSSERKSGHCNSAVALTAVNLQQGKRKVPVSGTGNRILPRFQMAWRE
jgi:hypothetical protein